jgi:hypothetical protein
MTKNLTVVGMLVGAVGIGILWASGVPFPFYPPPGILILVAGALFVALAPFKWAPAVGAALGLFNIVGFFGSASGIDNLTGVHGTGTSIGTVIQLIGIATAFVAGTLATTRAYSRVAV